VSECKYQHTGTCHIALCIDQCGAFCHQCKRQSAAAAAAAAAATTAVSFTFNITHTTLLYALPLAYLALFFLMNIQLLGC